MKSKNKEYVKNVSMVWGGCLVMYFLAYITLISPQNKIKADIGRELAQSQAGYDKAFMATQKESNIKLNEQIELLQSTSNDFVVDFADLADLTFEINRIADDHKIKLQNIKNRTDIKKPHPGKNSYLSEKRIDVTFKASFNRFAIFLNSLERHKPTIFVDEFVIRRLASDNSAHQVEMKLVVFVKNPGISEALTAMK